MNLFRAAAIDTGPYRRTIMSKALMSSSTRFSRCFYSLLPLIFLPQLTAREKPDRWLEVRSPHFIVAANGSEKQARRVADQFERMRAVFQKAFPGLRVDPAAPIVVLAVKDEKSFNALTPIAWQKKGQLKRAGLFLRGPEKNYVLLRLDAEGENPYHILYHEYTHLLVNQSMQGIPPWLDEGLAEFYGNSEIQGKDVLLGKPSLTDIELLRESKLLPLATLFAVDHASPYYNEETKGTIFYAESWALTHYLVLQARQGNKNPLGDFTKLLGQGADAKAAAVQAFGDLQQLGKALEGYVRQSSMKYVLMKGSTDVDEDDFKVQELSSASVAALRGDFLVYNQRYADARDLLTEALQEDPNNAQAAESMGFLEFQQGHNEEGKKWFSQAVKLNSQSYLAHYYYAVMTMQAGANGPDAAQVETSLQSAIKINPNFAPAYDALANLYAIRGDKLEEARKLTLQAVQLEPGNVRYRLNAGNVLLRMKKANDAVRVGKLALSMAKTPEDQSAAEAFLNTAQKYQEYLASVERRNQEIEAARAAATNAVEGGDSSASQAAARDDGSRPPVLRHRDESGKEPAAHDDSNAAPALHHRPEDVRGPRDARDGKIASVKCSSPAQMDLALEANGRTVELHTDNYFKVQFSALNFTPAGQLEPCTQIKGMSAHISFYDVKGQPYTGEIISIQLRK